MPQRISPCRTPAFERLEARTLLATFYVDPVRGSDASSGTSPAEAWRSIGRVNEQSLSPGDVVLFCRGGRWGGELVLSGDHGTADSPVQIGAYGSGAAPILEQVFVRGASDHVVIEDLVIDHQKQSGDAVRIHDSKNVVLRDLEIKNGTSDGIDFVDADGILLDGLHIHHFLAGSFTEQADAHGIVGSDTDGITIRGTEIHHVSGDSFQADPDRDTDITTNILIVDSHFWTSPLESDFNDRWLAGQRPGENAIDTKVVTSGWEEVPRMRIEVRNVVAHGWLADGFIANKAAFNMKEKVEALFDGVTVYDNEIAFRLRGTRGNADATLQNVVMYNHEKAIRAEDDLQNLRIYNSTFGAHNATMVQFAGGSGGIGTWDLKNNAFLGGLPSFAADPSNRRAAATDFLDVEQNDYRLADGSGLVDAGVQIPSVLRDHGGAERPRGTAYDVGAFEQAPLDGDYDGNGRIEQADLDLVLLNWGRPAEPPPDGWLNDLPEGTIDQEELDAVLANWGEGAPPD